LYWTIPHIRCRILPSEWEEEYIDTNDAMISSYIHLEVQLALSTSSVSQYAVRRATTVTVLALAWPAIVDQFLSMAVNMVDTAMVGRLGAAALAAVGLGAQIMMTATAIFTSISTGTTALIARHIGAGQPQEAHQVARQSIVAGLGLSVLCSICFVVFAHQIVHVMFGNAEVDVLADAAGYVRIIGAAVVPQFILVICNSILRGAGDTRTPMKVMAVSNVFNVIGNYLLIFGVGPFPRLGVFGAALSTALSHVVGGVIQVYIIFRGRRLIQLNWRDDWAPHFATIKRILTIGIPAGLEQGFMRVGQLLFTMILSGLGTIAFAAHRIALQAESLSFMPGFGFALSATTLVGQALGAGDAKAAERNGMEATRLAAIGMSAMGVLFFLFPKPLVSVFTTDQSVIEQSAVVLRIVALSQPFLALHMVLAGSLRGAGDTRTVMAVTAIGVCAIRVSLAYLLVRLGFGLVGAWIAMSVDLVTRGLLLFIRFRSGRWKHVHV
jgi:putative MATE family efflux protein